MVSDYNKMYLINILLLALISLANSDLPPSYSFFNGFDKFRPSHNLESSSGLYEYTQYAPNDYVLSLKTPHQVYGGPAQPPSHHHHHDNSHYPQLPSTQKPPQAFYNLPPNNGFGYQKPQNYFNIADLTPPQFQKPLFTPAGIASLEYPATHGQMDNYNKALQEEAQQLLQAQQQHQQQQQLPLDELQTTAFSNGFTGFSNVGIQPAKSYVNVKFGGPPNQQYQYQF